MTIIVLRMDVCVELSSDNANLMNETIQQFTSKEIRYVKNKLLVNNQQNENNYQRT